MVAVPSDAVIIGRPLVQVGAVLGDNGGIAGEGEGGEMGRHRLVAGGQGTRQAGRAGALALLGLKDFQISPTYLCILTACTVST